MNDDMIFLDCPEYLDAQGTARCGLPAEVQDYYTVRSSDGPLASVRIRCPLGHWFNGPVESMTWASEPVSGGQVVTGAAGRDGASLPDRPGVRSG